MTRRLPPLLWLVALAAFAGSFMFASLDSPSAQMSEEAPSETKDEGLKCTAPDEPLNFPAYWVGPSFDGLDLTGVLRSCDSPSGSAFGVNSVDYSYGECDASRGGCALPLSIQTWPSSVRHKGLYSVEPETEAGAVAGIPVEIWRSGPQVEIFMADVTIVVFGDDPARLDRVLDALREAPTIPAEVAAYGLVFDEGCVSERGYCQADLLVETQSTLGWIVIAVLLFLIGPLLAFLFRPAPAPTRQQT